MSSPDVAQQPFLARAFKDSLDEHDGSTVALLGCATGNGLEFVDKDVTRRVTAIDLNPEYLGILRRRYEECVPSLEIVEADLETCELEPHAYTLIFAALIFEYLEPRILLPRIANWLCSSGVLVSILQLPAKHMTKVSETPFQSLKKLDSAMHFISPRKFKTMVNEAGLQEREAKTVTLESGKPFFIGTYTKG
jgi:hypothetical protein